MKNNIFGIVIITAIKVIYKYYKELSVKSQKILLILRNNLNDLVFFKRKEIIKN